jgi:hypothetical protein
VIEWADGAPPVNVSDERFARLLGYPRGHQLSGRPRELAEQAREWHAAHGRPWIYARQAERIEARAGALEIESVAFSSRHILRNFVLGEANGGVLAAVSAGPELEQEAQRLWREDKPDEYYFYEIYGSAVVEALIEAAGARLCGWAEGLGLAVLPHYSPGYDGWDVGEQARLLALVGARLPSPIEALDSGALRPTKSQLAVFGLAPWTDKVRRLTELVPCYNCTLANCAYRR